MSKSIDDAVSEARAMVNDSNEPFRNTQSLLVAYLNSALLALYNIRPDAFIGDFTQGIISTVEPPTYTSADLGLLPATDFPVDDRQFFNPVVAYMAGRVELADDEYTADSRSTLLLNSFRQMLMGA